MRRCEMGAREALWGLFYILITGYAVVMGTVTVFFTVWFVKEWFWPSPELEERIAKMIERDVEEISLASWQEKKDLNI